MIQSDRRFLARKWLQIRLIPLVSVLMSPYVSYVSKCESGERRIDVVELDEFCRLYGVALIDFLKASGLA